MVVWGLTAFRRHAGIRRYIRHLVAIRVLSPSFDRAVPFLDNRNLMVPIPSAASVHRKSLGPEPPFPVVQALVFAIGAVTRIFLFADHFPARLRRRGHLPLAAVAEV